MNSLDAREGWLTLHEASSMTGIKIPTLRMAIKRGKYPGERVPTPNGHKWLIAIESLNPGEKSTRGTGRALQEVPASLEHPGTHAGRLLEEMGQRICEQSRHIAALEELAASMRREMKRMEEENSSLRESLLLLPAPVAEVIATLEEQRMKIGRLEETVALLEQDKKRAWW